MEPLGSLSQFGPFRPYDPPGYEFIPPSPDGGDAEEFWDQSLDEQGRRAYFSSRPSAEGVSSLSAWDWLDFQPTQAVPLNADLTVDGDTTESVEEDTFGHVELQELSPEPTAQSELSYGDGDVTMVEASEPDDEEKMEGDDKEGGEQGDALEEFGLYESQGLVPNATAQSEPSYNYDEVTMAVASELYDREEEEEEEETEEMEELAEMVEEDIADKEEGTLGLYELQGLSPEAMAQSEPSYDDEKETQAEEMEAEMEMEEAEEDEDDEDDDDDDLAEDIAAIEKELKRREREGKPEKIKPVPGDEYVEGADPWPAPIAGFILIGIYFRPDATTLSTTIISVDKLLTFNNHPNAAAIAEGHGRRELLDSLLSDGGDDNTGPTALRYTQCVMILVILVVSQGGKYRLDSPAKFQVIFTFLESGRATSSHTPPLTYTPMNKEHCKALLEWLVDASAVRSREDFRSVFREQNSRPPRDLMPDERWECADASTTYGIPYVIVYSAPLDKVADITDEFERLVGEYPILSKYSDTIAQVTTDIRSKCSGLASSHYLGQTSLKLSKRHPLTGTIQPNYPHIVPLLRTIWNNCGLGLPERLELGSVAKTSILGAALPDYEALHLIEHLLTSAHFAVNLNRIPGGNPRELPLNVLLRRQAGIAAVTRLPELLRIRARDGVRTSANEIYDDELRRQKRMRFNRPVANRATSARHPVLHPGLTVPRRSTRFFMPYSYETFYHPDSGEILDARQLQDTFALNLLPEYQNLKEPILNVYPVGALASAATGKMWVEREIWAADGTSRSVRISEVRGVETQWIRTSKPFLVLDSIRNPDRTPPAKLELYLRGTSVSSLFSSELDVPYAPCVYHACTPGQKGLSSSLGMSVAGENSGAAGLVLPGGFATLPKHYGVIEYSLSTPGQPTKRLQLAFDTLLNLGDHQDPTGPPGAHVATAERLRRYKPCFDTTAGWLPAAFDVSMNKERTLLTASYSADYRSGAASDPGAKRRSLPWCWSLHPNAKHLRHSMGPMVGYVDLSPAILAINKLEEREAALLDSLGEVLDVYALAATGLHASFPESDDLDADILFEYPTLGPRSLLGLPEQAWRSPVYLQEETSTAFFPRKTRIFTYAIAQMSPMPLSAIRFAVQSHLPAPANAGLATLTDLLMRSPIEQRTFAITLSDGVLFAHCDPWAEPVGSDEWRYDKTFWKPTQFGVLASASPPYRPLTVKTNATFTTNIRFVWTNQVRTADPCNGRDKSRKEEYRQSAEELYHEWILASH